MAFLPQRTSVPVHDAALQGEDTVKFSIPPTQRTREGYLVMVVMSQLVPSKILERGAEQKERKTLPGLFL